MKTVLLLLFFIPLISAAQSNYLNFDFEDTDSIGKTVTKINYMCYKTIVEINRDYEISCKGNNCLCIFSHNNDLKEGCTIYTSLPKDLCKGLRHVQVSLKSRYQSEQQNGGFWVFATKGIKYLGKATTFPGYFPFPIIFTFMWKPRYYPVFPYEWYSYNLDLNIEEDPDELLLGFYVRSGRVWYDDIKITLNNKPVDNLVFQIEK